MVNGSNGKNNYPDNLFSKNNLDHNVVNSIDGATALKLDENYEVKNSDEQNALIDSFEREEEQIVNKTTLSHNLIEEIPAGVSIESASYMENNVNSNLDENISQDSPNEEYTPKLFSEEQNVYDPKETNDTIADETTDQLFDQDADEEEDFEIPAFLRRQKF